MNFKQFMREDAIQSLQGNIGEATKNIILQILSQPAYAQWKEAFTRLQAIPQLYQQFMQELAVKSKNTYKLTPAEYIQLIQKYSLKAAGTNMPPQIQTTAPVAPAPQSTSMMVPTPGATQ